MRATPISAAASQKSGSKVEITVNATGRQSLSPPRAPEHAGKVRGALPSALTTPHVAKAAVQGAVTVRVEPKNN